MKPLWATYLRELRAYFFAPLAYVVLFFFLLVNGFLFSNLVGSLSDPRVSGPPFQYFFPFTWLVLILVCTILTMRLVSEELKTGSIEVLMTAPISEGQVIAGKYLAALTFFIFLWCPTTAYVLIIDSYEKVDWRPVAAGYLGVILVGALFLAIGLFASAMTRSQLVAAMMTAVLLILFLLLGGLEDLVNGETAKQALGYVNVWNHLSEFARGIVDSRRLVFYGSSTLFFLFLASRALEDKKWR